MSTTPTVKTRIFIISDTHEGFQNQAGHASPYTSSDAGSFRPPLPSSDILIHSGDLTMIGTLEQYRGALDLLASIPAELKLVIAGNHDLSLHEEYYLHHPVAKRIATRHYDPDLARQARELWTGEEARRAGVTYLSEGLHEFTLANGAAFSVYASPWQPVFFDWAFNYPRNEDRWNPPRLVDAEDPNTPGAVPAPAVQDPHPIPEGKRVDVVVTHGPPWMHRDRCSNGYRAGCPHLLKALARVRPLLHCFGHIHEAWGAEIVTWKETKEDANAEEDRKLAREERGKVGEVTEVLGALDGDGVSVQTPHDPEAIEQRANYADVSSGSRRPLRMGEETLLVNSCIMDLQYHAEGSGWLIDIDLPTTGGNI